MKNIISSFIFIYFKTDMFDQYCYGIECRPVGLWYSVGNLCLTAVLTYEPMMNGMQNQGIHTS